MSCIRRAGPPRGVLCCPAILLGSTPKRLTFSFPVSYPCPHTPAPRHWARSSSTRRSSDRTCATPRIQRPSRRHPEIRRSGHFLRMTSSAVFLAAKACLRDRPVSRRAEGAAERCPEGLRNGEDVELQIEADIRLRFLVFQFRRVVPSTVMAAYHRCPQTHERLHA
jgi:hypothetical protein